jgi:hypothetical protein
MLAMGAQRIRVKRMMNAMSGAMVREKRRMRQAVRVTGCQAQLRETCGGS